MRMKIIGFFLLLLLALESCNSNENKKNSFKDGFEYLVVEETNRKIAFDVINCSMDDLVKGGVLSELILKDYGNFEKASFYFKSKDHEIIDSLIFDKDEISRIHMNFKKHPCIEKSGKHILKNISNEKILFYDSVLYEIMIYDAGLNHLDTINYSTNDVSIVSILYNQCLYDKKKVPEKYVTQWKYFQVLHIWCEDKGYKLYDKKDFIW
jgi:hypothetical protein